MRVADAYGTERWAYVQRALVSLKLDAIDQGFLGDVPVRRAERRLRAERREFHQGAIYR